MDDITTQSQSRLKDFQYSPYSYIELLIASVVIWRESKSVMFRISVPMQADLIVEAEDVESITRWLQGFTFTDECSVDCIYQIRIARGVVNAQFQYDPAQFRAEAERQLLKLQAASQ